LASSVPAKQAGQAVLEACIMLALFLLMWSALSWLAGLQDIGLAAQHAGRQAAFMHARGSQDDMQAVVHRHFLSGSAHRWSLIDSGTLFDSASDASQVHVDNGTALSEQAQPGGVAPHAAALRHGWALQDSGIATARISVTTQASRKLSGSLRGDPAGHVMGGSWTLHRHTSVLTNAGHAEDDRAVQKRVADSRPAWAESAQLSYALARRISDRMGAVDSAWKRSPPRMDWLDAWEGAVPEPHLVQRDGEPHGR
jgi:hypothetical protein